MKFSTQVHAISYLKSSVAEIVNDVSEGRESMFIAMRSWL